MSQAEKLRAALVKAKRARTHSVWGTVLDEPRRRRVDAAARKCREAGVDISDLVGPGVGQL